MRVILGFVLACVAVGSAAIAQEVERPAAGAARSLLLENEHVRIFRLELPPGESTGEVRRQDAPERL